MDESDVNEEAKIQKDISNDIFKNESKSDESNGEVSETDAEKAGNGTKQKTENTNAENHQVAVKLVSSAENTQHNAESTQTNSTKNTEIATKNTEIPTTENIKDTSTKNAPNSSEEFSNENTQITSTVNIQNPENTITKNTEDTSIETTENTENIINADKATDAINMDTDDPLLRPKFTRKMENLSCGVPIRDFSDPLRATLSVDDDVFLPKEEATLKADAQNERYVFILSIFQVINSTRMDVLLWELQNIHRL